MHPLQQQLDELRKYHEALGTKLASLERHLDPGHEAPTLERQNYAVSSDSSVMYEGRRYSFRFNGVNIWNVIILKTLPNTIETDHGILELEYITQVREVKEQPADQLKEWEIVEFRTTENHYTPQQIISRDYSNTGWELAYLNIRREGFVEIHAVRRLRDDTIWRVGDIISNETGGIGKITEFRLTQGVMNVNAECYFSFSLLSRLKKPESLFTTADGVAVCEGETVWYTNRGKEVEQRKANREMVPYLHYSTRKAAQAVYDKWLFEQPVLTFNDVTTYDHAQLKKLIKDKMGKK